VFATIFLWDCSLLQTHLTTHLIKSGLHRCTVAKRAPNVFAKLQLSCQGLIADVLGQAFGTASCDGGTKPQGKKNTNGKKKFKKFKNGKKGKKGKTFKLTQIHLQVSSSCPGLRTVTGEEMPPNKSKKKT
jgi:hypothetical protein